MTQPPPRKVNWTVIGIGLALILPMLWLFATSFGNNPRAIPSMLEGEPAPDFTLVDLDGTPVTLSELKGTPVVVNFWSTWCGPCKYEHPYLLQAARSNPDVRFLGVIYNDEPEKCRRYLAQAGSAYPHLVDASSRTAIDYGVGGVPETFFINRAGEIVHKQNGPLDNRALSFHLSRIKDVP